VLTSGAKTTKSQARLATDTGQWQLLVAFSLATGALSFQDYLFFSVAALVDCHPALDDRRNSCATKFRYTSSTAAFFQISLKQRAAQIYDWIRAQNPASCSGVDVCCSV
jgi:hypothetical protein